MKRKKSRSRFEPGCFRLPAYRLTARPNRLSRHKMTTLGTGRWTCCPRAMTDQAVWADWSSDMEKAGGSDTQSGPHLTCPIQYVSVFVLSNSPCPNKTALVNCVQLILAVFLPSPDYYNGNAGVALTPCPAEHTEPSVGPLSALCLFVNTCFGGVKGARLPCRRTRVQIRYMSTFSSKVGVWSRQTLPNDQPSLPICMQDRSGLWQQRTANISILPLTCWDLIVQPTLPRGQPGVKHGKR